jgi:Na+/H+ antiporter NhaC
MMDGAGWWSIAPPVLAVALAIRTRQVHLSLFIGIWLGWTILAGGNPVAGLRDSLEGVITVLSDVGNAKILTFSALVGVVLVFTQASGGVSGFIDWIVGRGLVKSPRGAGVLAWCIGCIIFIESNITALVTGSVSRPIFDRLSMAREKLAYICDSTAAPVCILIPLNAWGAFIIGLLAAEGYAQPVKTMFSAMPLNFYAIGALFFTLYIAWSRRDFGPMKHAERRAMETGKVLRDGARPMVPEGIAHMDAPEGVAPRARNFLIPALAMIVTMPLSLWITGDGDLTQGSGSTSVLWAVCAAIICGGAAYRVQGIFSLTELTDLFFKGISALVPLVTLLLLAFAIGDVSRELQTGPFVADLVADLVNPVLVPVVLFLTSCFVAFSTGTSWGTFAIMVPIAVPMAAATGVNDALLIAAVLGGGIFGDHCSPISDTTIISSMASASDHIDHVRTQLPYALVVAAVAVAMYGVFGWIGA